MLVVSTFLAVFLLCFSFVNGANAQSCNINASFNRDLQQGAQGQDVTALQQYLVSSGHLNMPKGSAYGYFGSVTKTALIKYQKQTGLRAEGYFGPLTKKTILAKCTSSQYSKLKPTPNTYVDPFPLILPTAQEVANMPVYTATKIQSNEISTKILYPSMNSLPITSISTGLYGLPYATINFKASVEGGSGNYRTFWFFDNLSTPQLYDQSANETYFTTGKERNMTQNLSGTALWLVSEYVTDDIGRKSATSSTIVFVLTKTLAEKLDRAEKAISQKDVDELAKDPEVMEFVSQVTKSYSLLETHPEAKASLEVSYMKSSTAAVQSSLRNVRAQAELYYSMTNNSYTGLCNDRSILKLFESAEGGLTGKVNCIATSQYWRAFGTLKENGDLWCVDSTGVAGPRTQISGYTCDPKYSKTR